MKALLFWITVIAAVSLAGCDDGGDGTGGDGGPDSDAQAGADMGAIGDDGGVDGGLAERRWRVLAGETVYTAPELGLTIEISPDSEQSFTHNPDGSIDFDFVGLVTLEGDDPHPVAVFVVLEPVATGARQTLFTLDLLTDEERWFHFEPEDNAVVVGDEDGGVFVFANPDGSFDVATSLFDEPVDDALLEHAEDGFVAWEILQDYNHFTDASKYSLIMAVGAGQAPSLETRSFSCCEEPGCANKKAGLPPPACTIFAEFCQCTFCQATGTTDGACARCQLP